MKEYRFKSNLYIEAEGFNEIYSIRIELIVVIITELVILILNFIIPVFSFYFNLFIFSLLSPLTIYLIFYLILEEKALYFFITYAKNNILKADFKDGAKTFCRWCGVFISREIFKDQEDNFIEFPGLLFSDKYFCKKCFKKNGKFLYYISLITLSINLVAVLSYYFLIIKDTTLWDLIQVLTFLPMTSFFLGFLFLRQLSFYNKYLEKYH